MQIKNIPKLAFSILICESAGFIGSFFTVSSIPTWYATLNKPSFSPPNWVFFPVWTALFALMGIALYAVWESRSEGKKSAMMIFGLQLFLNLLWTIIFFGLHEPLTAFIEIIALWMAILLSITMFYRISKPAGYLLLPYILWVSFAAVLNFSIFWLNKGA